MVLGAEGRVIGILSERDIVRTFAQFGSEAPTKRLAQIMTREVATCGEADTAVSIMERMTATESDTFRWLTGIGWSASCRSATSSNTACGKWSGVHGIARLYSERLACTRTLLITKSRKEPNGVRRNNVALMRRNAVSTRRSLAACSREVSGEG